MCTPGNIPPLCSCPHLLWWDLRRVARVVGLVALAVAVWVVVTAVPWWELVIASGYAWMLGVVAWLVVMAGAAQVSSSRRRRVQFAATRAAGARGTGTAVSRPRPTARPLPRTRAPGETVSRDRLPALRGQ